MVEYVKDASTYLYHYTSAKTALDYILKTKLLRFSPYSKTNDPKEKKSWQFEIGTNKGLDLNAYDTQKLSSWLSSELKSRTRLLCFSMDKDPIYGNHIDDIFNRGYCKPRMWAQYAEKHTGVCLVFNQARLTELIAAQVAVGRLTYSGPVKYIDRSIVKDLFKDQEYLINVDVLESEGRSTFPARHLHTHWRKLFFEKMTDWRDECEWRHVVFTNSDADLFVAYEQALDAVVFGEETPHDTIQAVIDATAHRGIRYLGLKWKNCSPWYDYESMSTWRPTRAK